MEWILEGMYGSHGWELLTTEETKSEILERKREYQENEGGTYRIRRVRV